MPNLINVSDFALSTTVECGQAFRWSRTADCWFEGVVGRRVIRLRQHPHSVEWESRPPADKKVVARYLALDVSLPDILATFPGDPLLRRAVKDHHGLRVIRQEPWECLASFIASSSKQIVQIRQIVDVLARRFGEPVSDTHHAFPTVAAVARATHQQLWDCKLGFRAKNLLAAARLIDNGKLDLDALPSLEYGQALEELIKLPGVGEKIANCTLLFACGFNQAFPIDVWIERALRRIYFDGKKRVTTRELRKFAHTHFGPYAGWAQQYLFFSERSLGQQRPRRRQALLDAGAK
jgi:N-glycosylase/DNA lyase